MSRLVGADGSILESNDPDGDGVIEISQPADEGTLVSGAVVGGQGIPGESAYQVWLDAGNVGTVDDFLASLVGPQGEPGSSDDFFYRHDQPIPATVWDIMYPPMGSNRQPVVEVFDSDSPPNAVNVDAVQFIADGHIQIISTSTFGGYAILR